MSEHEGQPLFSVSNHHLSAGHAPPALNGDDADCYHSYFENRHGEQMLFVYHWATRQAILWHGDLDWEPRPVVEGRVDVRLGGDEQLWLQACWQASAGRERS